MKKVIHLVDSLQYVQENCFQHQLLKALHDLTHVNVQTISLNDLSAQQLGDDVIGVVSCLKQRTLYANITKLKNVLGDLPFVAYDQDPWHAYMDGSQFVGTYELLATNLNLKFVAVTTSWWAKYLEKRGIPASFVRMWVLPEYCQSSNFEERSVDLGFKGTVHGYRKTLFDSLAKTGNNVQVVGGGKSYNEFLSSLSTMKVFIHHEDLDIRINSTVETNLSQGLWIKDIEAAARGCFSIRNRGKDDRSYMIHKLPTVKLYDSFEEIPAILADIRGMDPVVRQKTIDQTVEFIRGAAVWQETAAVLVSELGLH